MRNTLTSNLVLIPRMARGKRVRRLLSTVATTLYVLVVGALLWCVPVQAEEACPNAASRRGPSLNLPECRVYEQVTPVDKGDAIDLFPNSTIPFTPTNADRGYAAEQGNAFLLNANASIGASAPTLRASYVFTRGASRWQTNVLVPPVAQTQALEADVFDPVDLSAVGFEDVSGAYSNLVTGNEAAFQNRKLVGAPAGPFATLSLLSGFSAAEESEQSAHLVGGSDDLSHVILESRNHTLAPGASGQDAGSEALYESTGGSECGSETSSCRLVNVNSQASLLSACGATLGQGTASDDNIAARGGTHSAVSSDGSRIIFTAPDPNLGESGAPGCWKPAATPQENPPEVYVREGATRTIEVSAPELGVNDPDGLQPAVFVGASADGAKIFFMTKTELTADDTTHAPELYEYNAEPAKGEKALTRISRGISGTAEGNVDFVGAVSSAGSAVYFAAFGELAPGGSKLTPGPKNNLNSLFAPVNLYRYDTLTGTTTYITQLNATDYPLFPKLNVSNWGAASVFAEMGVRAESVGLAAAANWYTTADGQYLVFGTDRPIAGYDNTAAPGVECATYYAISVSTCGELYRYDAVGNGVVCVSCAGGAPVDDAVFARAGLTSPAGLPPRPVSENGDVFFETANALVPQATAGRVHVYEWHDGTLSMISPPGDPGEAFFLGSSADGRDVFFSTHSQLGPQDTDVSADIYDARVDGGFPGVAVPQCTGTGCQGVPAAAPIFATPASVTFEGVGNFPTVQPSLRAGAKPKPRPRPKKCRRGFVRKRDRCVKVKVVNGSAKGRK